MYGPTTGPPMPGWTFQVPAGWPAPPVGWTPPAGWQPDPSWPAPPPGWQFWVPPGGQVAASRATAPTVPAQATRVAVPRVPVSAPDHFGAPTPAAPRSSGWVAPAANASAAPPVGGPGPRHRASSDPWPTQERPHSQRVWLMILFLVGLAAGWYVLDGIFGTVFTVNVNPADYATEADYREAWNGAAVNATLLIRGCVILLNAILFGLLAQRAGFGGSSSLLLLIPVIGTVVAFRILWRWTDINHWERTVGYPGKSYFRGDRPNMTLRQKQYV